MAVAVPVSQSSAMSANQVPGASSAMHGTEEPSHGEGQLQVGAELLHACCEHCCQSWGC